MILSGEVPRVVNKWWHEEPFLLGNLVFLCRVCSPKSSLFLGLGVKLVSRYISFRTHPSYIVCVYPIPRSPQYWYLFAFFEKLMVTSIPMCIIVIRHGVHISE